MACLFSRKLDLVRTHNLLLNNWKWRKENNFTNLPRFSEIPKELWKTSGLSIGMRTKEGNGLAFIVIKDFEIGIEPFTVSNMIKFFVWFYCVGMFSEGMDYFRNGIEIVEDLEGYGWKHFDLDFQKKVGSMWHDTFPLRVKKIHVLNPPAIFDAIMKIAKSLTKSKILDRIEFTHKQDLTKHIDKSDLPEHFGGNFSTNFEATYSFFSEWAKVNEERFISPGRQE